VQTIVPGVLGTLSLEIVSIKHFENPLEIDFQKVCLEISHKAIMEMQPQRRNSLCKT
jgi:hypothetical protein